MALSHQIIIPIHCSNCTKNINACNAWGFDLSAACSGYIFGLETGSNFIESGKYQNVMVIGVDTMSSILDFQDRDTCVIFGDGGGGAILQPTKKGMELSIQFYIWTAMGVII